jgi:hypothetical protein
VTSGSTPSGPKPVESQSQPRGTSTGSDAKSPPAAGSGEPSDPTGTATGADPRFRRLLDPFELGYRPRIGAGRQLPGVIGVGSLAAPIDRARPASTSPDASGVPHLAWPQPHALLGGAGAGTGSAPGASPTFFAALALLFLWAVCAVVRRFRPLPHLLRPPPVLRALERPG